MLLFLLFDNSVLAQSLIQHPVISFACFAVSDIDNFRICAFPFVVCILAYKHGLWFCYELMNQCDVIIA